MASQDTLQAIRDEEERAKTFQSEIAKEQLRLDSLQEPADRESKQQIIASLEQKLQQHTSNIDRLRQQASEEQKQEQAELIEQQRQSDSSLKKTAERVVKSGLFW